MSYIYIYISSILTLSPKEKSGNCETYMKIVPVDQWFTEDWFQTVGIGDKKEVDRSEICISEVDLIEHGDELKWEVRERSVKVYTWIYNTNSEWIELIFTEMGNTGEVTIREKVRDEEISLSPLNENVKNRV